MGDEALWTKGRSIRMGKFMVCMEIIEQPIGSCTREWGSWE